MKRIVCFVSIFLLCLALLQIVDAQTRRIYIDPGHYKGKSGASSTLDKELVTEAEITLAVALKLRDLLEKDTFTGVRWVVEMSRETPVSKTVFWEDEEGIKRKFSLNSLPNRAEHANQFKAELFLSIHCNSQADKEKIPEELKGTGTETFWCNLSGDPGNSERFARLVQRHMVFHGKWNDRRVIDDESYLGYHLAVLRHLEVPGCLSEIGFLSKLFDLEKLVSPYWQWRFAEAYRDAIYDFFGLTRPIYFRITLEPGWNMLSIPGTPANTNPRSLVGKEAVATPTVRQLLPAGKGYQPVFTLRIGEGYFVSSAFPDAVIQDETMVSYFPKHIHTIHLEKGFTMIGSVSDTVSFADIVHSVNKEGEDKRINETLWTWDAERQRFERVESSTIEPGGGYYVQAYTDITIVISSVFTPAPIPAPSQTLVETQLLANFPNPFNPETWIPFTLKEAGGVTVSIHAASGHLVRTLDLGHLRSGFYATKDAAAYWDGRNAQGDKVASGVYFYTLETDAVSYTRKMLLLK